MLKKIKVKDLGTIITGNTPPKNRPELYGSHTPFIKATDINEKNKYTYLTEEYYSEEAYNKYKKSLIPKNSTCVVTIGSVGKKLTMAHCDCFINQAMNAIVPNQNYDSEYVYYLLKNNIHKLKSLNSGTASGRENISKTAFSNMELVVEQTKSVQKKIGQVLATYDTLLENKQKQVKLLEEAAQRMYKEWFVRLNFPDKDNVKIIDGIPEGWEIKKLNEIAEITMGQSPKSIFYNHNQEGLPFHQGVGSFGDRFVIDTIYTSKSQKVAYENSILFSVRAPVGRINLIKNKIAIGRGLASINHKQGFQSFLFYMLKDKFFKEDLVGNGSIFASITKNQLEDLKFLIPSYNLAKKFNEIAKNIDRQIWNKDSEIRLLLDARDRLLPKLMNGVISL